MQIRIILSKHHTPTFNVQIIFNPRIVFGNVLYSFIKILYINRGCVFKFSLQREVQNEGKVNSFVLYNSLSQTSSNIFKIIQVVSKNLNNILVKVN